MQLVPWRPGSPAHKMAVKLVLPHHKNTTRWACKGCTSYGKWLCCMVMVVASRRGDALQLGVRAGVCAACVGGASYLSKASACTVCRWGLRPIQFILPDELGAATKEYVELHRPLLALASTRTLFVTASGDEFEPSGFCAYWKGMLAAAEASGSFPPRLLRNIWVSLRVGFVPCHVGGVAHDARCRHGGKRGTSAVDYVRTACQLLLAVLVPLLAWLHHAALCTAAWQLAVSLTFS